MKEFAFEVGLIARVRVRAPDEASARRAVPSVIGAPGAQDIALANQGIDVLLPGVMVTAVDFIPDRKVKLGRARRRLPRKNNSPADSAWSRRGILRVPAGSQRRGQGPPNKSPARVTGLGWYQLDGCIIRLAGLERQQARRLNAKPHRWLHKRRASRAARGKGGLAGRLGHAVAVAHPAKVDQQARPINGRGWRLVAQRAGKPTKGGGGPRQRRTSFAFPSGMKSTAVTMAPGSGTSMP